jgi:hypothetical protein
MSLAIGIWLYDTSSRNKQTVDLNATMLAAMGIQKNSNSSKIDPKLSHYAKNNPFKPVIIDSMSPKNNGEEPHPVYGDISWLLK